MFYMQSFVSYPKLKQRSFKAKKRKKKKSHFFSHILYNEKPDLAILPGCFIISLTTDKFT